MSSIHNRSDGKISRRVRVSTFDRRRLVGLGTMSLVALTVFWLVGGVAVATTPVPIQVEGNATCGELGELAGQPGWIEFYKAEPVISGSHTSGDRTISWTVRNTADGQVFDWASNFDLHGVFAKGGNTGGNLYVYLSGARGDGGLHAPVNPSGTWGGLSHISFCYNSTSETSTTPSTGGPTSPTEGPTTPTEGPTSPTEGPTSPTAGADNTAGAAPDTAARVEVLETTITAAGATVAETLETLPFTGVALNTTGGIAFSLVAMGGLILLSFGYRRGEAYAYQGRHRRATGPLFRQVR